MKDYIKRFNESEMRLVANALEVKKVLKDKRIFCAGDESTDFFVIARGQVAILNPHASVSEYQRNKTFADKVIGVREKYVAQAIEERTFITRTQQIAEEKNETEEEKERIARERRQKCMESNELYRQFDQMLGLDQNKSIVECQMANPLYQFDRDYKERLANPKAVPFSMRKAPP